MTTNAHHVEAVIVQRNHYVIVQRVGVSLNEPRLGNAEGLTTHVTQQTLGALDVYLHDRGTMLLQQRVNLRRVEHRVRHDRHAIITTNLNQIPQVHINRDDGNGTKPEPMIDGGDVAAIVAHPEVASTKIQHGDARAVDVSPMIDGRFAADPIVQVWRVKVHGSLRSLRLA